VSRPTTEPLVIDATLPAGTSLDLPIPPGHNAFVYVYGGEAAEIGGAAVASDQMAILGNDAEADGVRLRAAGGAVQVLIVAGKPLREPIAQYGPFVMNTTQELHQAVADFQRGVLAG
jgi:redox-sensitive bicupin YhaK (pirin superfamily)